MTLHKTLDQADNFDRLYVSRKEGAKGIASVGDCVDISV